MDLSAVIFVVLAIAWAGYLIPKALKHHDDVAASTLDESRSDKARILSRRRNRPDEAAPPPMREGSAERQTGVERGAPTSRSRALTAPSAARRRRRVLYVLLCAVAVVAGLSFLGIAPTWLIALPAGLTVAFLVAARLSVRAQRNRLARPAARQAAPADAAVPADETDPDEGPVGILQQERDAILADDGSLWDPLPMNLPTYVGKARARRTVRTIELTGISSSGHDPVDTALVRQADEARKAVEAGQADQAGQSAIEAEIGPRKVAGA